MTPIPQQDILLTEVAAADILCVSIRTLQAWRVRGDGPPFVKVGRAVRYRRNDLETWVEGRTARSTSQPLSGGGSGK